jgi:hypothetical protein
MPSEMPLEAETGDRRWVKETVRYRPQSVTGRTDQAASGRHWASWGRGCTVTWGELLNTIRTRDDEVSDERHLSRGVTRLLRACHGVLLPNLVYGSRRRLRRREHVSVTWSSSGRVTGTVTLRAALASHARSRPGHTTSVSGRSPSRADQFDRLAGLRQIGIDEISYRKS